MDSIDVESAVCVVPVEERDVLKLHNLIKSVHILEMELLKDGVDNGDEPDLDDGKDIVKEESDDEAWTNDTD